MKKFILTAAIALTMMLPIFVSAQGLKDAGKILGNIGGESGERLGVSGDLATSIATVIKAVLALVGTIFLVMTIYAGIMWMTAQGNEETVTKAMGVLKAAVIGLVIVMSAYAITYFVTSRLGAAGGNNQQNVNEFCVQNPLDPSCAQ